MEGVGSNNSDEAVSASVATTTGGSSGINPIWKHLSPGEVAVLRTATTALCCGQRVFAPINDTNEPNSASINITWFPEYACALLGLKPGPLKLETKAGKDGAAKGAGENWRNSKGGDEVSDDDDGTEYLLCRPGEMSLHLVVLDGWEFRLHRYVSYSQYGCVQHLVHIRNLTPAADAPLSQQQPPWS